MTLDTGEVPRRELSLPNNSRYIGYNLLQNIRFAGEPVVPIIIREVQDKLVDYFEVESLPGSDLGIFLKSPGDIHRKLLVINQVVKQLQEIDRNGFVLFDRKEDNIRVCNGDPNHISVRQTDIEDIYDKETDAIYSFDNRSGYEQMIDDLKKRGINLWSPSVLKLSHAILGLSGLTDEMKKILQPFNKFDTMPVRQNVLQQFKQAINQAI